jgi:hypothetical protein
MQNIMRKRAVSVLVMISLLFVATDFSQAKRSPDRDREHGEYIETVHFDYYRNREDNRRDCRDYRRNEDDRCNSSVYKCTKCRSSRRDDETYNYRVYRERGRDRDRDRGRDREVRSVWVNAGVARGTGSWENHIMPRGWPKCGVIRNGQRDTLNRICRDAGYGRAIEHTVIGHGRCARTANDGRNWHAWGNGEIAGRVRCSVY